MLKVFEIIRSIKWIIYKGRLYGEEVIQLVEETRKAKTINAKELYSLEKKHQMPLPLFWYLRKRYAHIQGNSTWLIRLALLINRIYGQYIHRCPSLLVLISFILMFFPKDKSVWVEITLTICLILLELLNMLCSRAILGFADNFRSDFKHDPTTNDNNNLICWSKTQFIAKFMFGISIFLLTSIFGFAAIYFGIDNFFSHNNSVALNGLNRDGNVPVQIQVLYFSITTIATVGYGDIFPKPGWGQVIAGLEMLFGLWVIVFLFFALSSTFTLDSS